MRKWGFVMAVVLGLVLAAGTVSAARQDRGPEADLEALARYWQDRSEAVAGPEQNPSLQVELLAKAEPDECYNGPGVPYTGTAPICDYGLPKVNQAYVWGLAKAGDDLWFGTAPNTHCLVLAGYLGITAPLETESYVCEFGESQYSPPLSEEIGDWRPPDLFVYDTQAMTLTEKTPADPLIQTTQGLRSAGALDGVVLLAGPSLVEGINVFAFDTETGAYLGSANIPDYDNIRKWIVVDGVLYTGVRNAVTGGGHVLRWTGSAADPFQFEVVGNLPSQVAELALHDGRLVVTTWPNRSDFPVEQAGLFMGPSLPAGGLTAADADAWEGVWQAGDYEPDPLTAATYGGGALHSFGGYLYWGTMHVPFVATLAHIEVYGPPDSGLEAAATFLGTQRAISIFRGRNLGTADQEIELLYGSALLPVHAGGEVWLLLPNNMGSDPLWGEAGFGNPFNNYAWIMEEYGGQLYVGTMDWSYLLDDLLPLVEEALGIPPEIPIPLPVGVHGADLFRFRSAGVPAEVESLEGVGNPTSYGIRTAISDDALYLGMANPMNLLTDPDDDLPEGGWELLRLSRPAGPRTIYLPLVVR